jgi:hypothetical protein
VWPLGVSLIGIAIAVIISSKTLRQKIADTFDVGDSGRVCARETAPRDQGL